MAIALTAGSLFLIVCLSLLEGWFDRVFRHILFLVVMLAILTTAEQLHLGCDSISNLIVLVYTIHQVKSCTVYDTVNVINAIVDSFILYASHVSYGDV